MMIWMTGTVMGMSYQEQILEKAWAITRTVALGARKPPETAAVRIRVRIALSPDVIT